MRRPVLWALAVLLSLAAVSPPPGAASLLTPALFFDEPHADLTPAELTLLALRSALAFGVNTKQLPIMRAAHPGMKILLYEHPAGSNTGASDYPYLDRHESWWVHDDSGSRMHEARGGTNWAWLLNIDNSGYSSYEQNRIADQVGRYDYDGYFLDTSNPYWPIFRDWYDVNNRPTSPTDNVLRNWPDWMLSFHRQLRAMTGRKIHIFNSWPNTPGRYQDYRSWLEATLQTVDGVQFDGFCYNRTHPWSPAAWEQQVASAQRIVGMGKMVLLKSPFDNLRSKPTLLEQLQRLCFGSYLLVARGRKAYFRNPDETDIVYWNERLFTAPVGSPDGAYYKTGGVYRRDFTNGTVIVNGNTTGASLSLGRVFYTLSGLPVTSVRLAAWDGAVLLKSPP